VKKISPVFINYHYTTVHSPNLFHSLTIITTAAEIIIQNIINKINNCEVLQSKLRCSVAVPPTLHVIFILTATPLFLLVAVAIGLE